MLIQSEKIQSNTSKRMCMQYTFQCDHCGCIFTSRDSKKKQKHHFCPKPATCAADSMRQGGCRHLANGGVKPRPEINLSDADVVSRTRRCQMCGCSFVDRTKRGVRRDCSRSCSLRRGVETRHKRGTYICTDERRERLSNTLCLKYKNGWRPHTEKLREDNRQRMKAFWASGEMARKTKQTCLNKYGCDHWTKTQQGRRFLSLSQRGRVFTFKTKERMRQSHSKRLRLNPSSLNTWATGGIRSDLGQYFRSHWEANFARICTFENFNWQYEPTTFTLSSGKTYTPDFLVGDTYYEIKGRWLGEAKEKFDLFQLDHPECKIVLISGIIYLELKRKYKHLINWDMK